MFAKTSENQKEPDCLVASSKNNPAYLAKMQKELSVIQKMYDLILWFVPLVNKFPRDYKFTLGDRFQNQMYDILEELILARYEKEKLARLERINGKLDILRYQTRLLLDFKLIDGKRFYHASELINGIGVELGGWTKQQKPTK